MDRRLLPLRCSLRGSARLLECRSPDGSEHKRGHDHSQHYDDYRHRYTRTTSSRSGYENQPHQRQKG
jgi:hypothetical protein